MSGWFVYILRCADGSFYTGITRDVMRRVEEHNHDDMAAAKYTRGRRPVMLVYSEACLSRSAACRREFAIKQLNRGQKTALIDGASDLQ